MRFVFLPVHLCIHIYITKLVNARKPTQHTQHIYTLYRKASSRGFWRIINESRRRNALDKLPARVSCDFSIESPIAASHERLMGNALRRVAHPNRLFFFLWWFLALLYAAVRPQHVMQIWFEHTTIHECIFPGLKWNGRSRCLESGWMSNHVGGSVKLQCTHKEGVFMLKVVFF